MAINRIKLVDSLKSFLNKPFLLALIAIILSDQSFLLSLNINMHTFSVILYLTGLWAIITTLILKEKIDLGYINKYILILFALFLGKSLLYIIDRNIIRNKFKEVCPNYDDSEAVEKERKQGNIILAILLLPPLFKQSKIVFNLTKS